LAEEPVRNAEVASPVARGGTRRIGAGAVVALLLISVAVLPIGLPAPPAKAAASGLGNGILSVDGVILESVSLLQGRTYYLTVATDSASTYVNASLTYNGSLLAQENASLTGSTFASLPAGDYSLSLAGHGRAALGWDFTNGAVHTFPDNATLVAFLNPSGPRVQIAVSRGDAQTVQISLYDGGLLPVGNATVSSDGTLTFDLPPARAGVAYLVAQASGGNPSGMYGLSWTSGLVNPPLDFTAWPLFLLWILVPVAVAFLIFVALHRRGRR